MSGNITVASTTDSPEEVEQALGLEPGEVSASATSPAAKGKTPAPESGDGSGPSDNGDESADDDAAQATKDQADATDEDQDPDADSDDNQDDEDPDSDDEDAQAKLDADGKPIKGKGGFQKKIDKQTKKIRTLETELVVRDRALLDLRGRLENLEKTRQTTDKTETTEAKPAAQTSTLRDEPKVSDFQTYEAYLQDLGKWTKEAIADARNSAETKAAEKVAAEVQKLRDEFKAQTETKAKEEAQDQIHADFNTRVETEAKKLYPDWDRVVTQNQDLIISEVQNNVMLRHPKGHHLAYWYGKHPAETERIAKLPADLQLLELGQILPTLGKPSKPKSETTKATDSGAGEVAASPTKPKASAAPRPVKPAGSGRPAKTSYTQQQIDNMSYQEYKTAREEGRI